MAVLGTAGLVLVGAVVVTSAHDSRPMQTSEGAQVFTAQQFDEAVTFYRQVCPSLLGLRSAPDVYSRAVEDSIGKDTSTVDDALRAAVDGIAADARTGAAALPRTAPQVPSVEQVRPVDYTPALDAARTVLAGQARTLAAATAGAGTTDTSADRPDPSAERLRDAVGDAATAAGGVLDDLSTTAPLPNRKAVDAVAAAPECDGLFADSPVDPETVHRPQVDLYAAADRAHRTWEKTVDRYSEQDGTDHSGMTADLRDAAAEAATVLQRWLDDNPADPVTGDTEAARDAVSVYRGIAAKATDAADAAATADADPQSWVDDEAKLQVRLPRSAPAVNRPTADALAERD
ncbi:hypothetical protein [Corynebacterium nuruki]|uniref:hypothetical protein n=1 Tax=Corynebacterium nuruki TaxID=1032851 RepID=UPI0039BF1B16